MGDLGILLRFLSNQKPEASSTRQEHTEAEMPMDRSLYPPDWDDIALQVKEAADWHCEECGQMCRRPKQRFLDFANELINLGYRPDFDHPQKYTLTVAHLNHIPSDCRPENLRAMCSGCHLRYDGKDMALKKRLKRERQGQLRIAGV
jgi:hypothetical protein